MSERVAPGLFVSATGSGPPGPPGSGVTSAFVYQQGGPSQHDNVFTNWADLVTAVNAVAGIRSILVDPTFAGGGGPTVPAGTWALDNVILYGDVPSTGFIPSLTFEDEATIINTSTLYSENLILASASTVPVLTLSGGNGLSFIMTLGAVFGSSSAPFFLAATDSGTVTITALGASELGDGTNPFIEADGATSCEIQLIDQSLLFANATSGTGVIGLTFTPGATISPTGGFPNPADMNVQFPQLAGLSPDNLSAQTPYWVGQQFLANLLPPATVIGVDGIQTADNNPTPLPNLALGTAATPLPDHSSGVATLRVIAVIPGTGQTVMWHAEAAFKRDGAISVGTLLNVGGNALSIFGATGGDAAAFAGATIGFAITANGIVPEVTGLLGTVIDWQVKPIYFYTHA